MSEVTLAAACMNVAHDKAANLEKYLRFIDEAASLGARLLVFPEVSLQGYLKKRGAPGEPEVIELTRYYRKTAETVPGPTTELIGEYAARHNMYIQIGMAESARAGQVFYNSAVLVGPEGVVGVHRKLHDRGEWPVFCSGDEFPLLETSLGQLGAFICYDMCFPETVRMYAIRGAVIASMSTAWPLKNADAPDPEADHYAYVYDTLTRAHAIANQVFFISSNQVGPTGRFNYYGHSRIIAPTGIVLADSGREEKLIAAAVDIERDVDLARTETLFFKNLLRDRRPETYGALVQT
ncbi:MAG TPA: carbon-nitrogen hydrolase family protein [Anaerolineae bacterium]|nr:carbon-nitrogen hydrolase family protein [Anaerolineae bacterium]